MKSVCKSFVYLSFSLATLAVVSNVRAQSIIPDNSLGNENSVVTPNVDLGKGIPSDRIDGGATRGNNLFHSFSKFNVDAGRGAYFSNPAGIENIISRVTGINPSNILGTLGVLGNANLFFANPNGIVFGPNARLDVSGSFFASTSDGFRFDNGFEFSASNPQAPPLLTINIPIGLRFRDNPGSITIGNDPENDPTRESLSFEVQPEKTLAFVGGEINLNGRRLRAPGGRIELGALAAQGTVGINNDLSLSFPDNVARADVSLNSAEVDVTSGDKGSISINARNINVRGGADICAGIGADGACGGLATNFGSVGSQAGDINLNALDTITIADRGSVVFNHVNSNAVGNSGNINIKTKNLFLNDGGQISTSIFGRGNSGKININAGDTVSLERVENPTLILSNIYGFGKSGGVDITTGSLSLKNFSSIQSTIVRRGDSGKVKITARDRISFNNGSIISDVNSSRAVGNSGGIDITTGSLFLTNGGQIRSNTNGIGNSGKIKIVARDTVSFDGRRAEDRVASAVYTRVTGDVDGANGEARSSGGIEISTGSLSITNRAQIGSATRGKGNPGDIVIDARDQVSLSNSIIISEVNEANENNVMGGIGDAADIKIKTGSLILKDGSALFANTQNIGNAGNIIIDARDAVILEGRGPGSTSNSTRIVPSKIDTTVESIGITTEGEGSNINISTGLLSIKDGGFISSFTKGIGNAGDITVNARDIQLLNGSSINGSVRLGGTGIGGDINLNGQTLTLADGSTVVSQTLEAGNAGNIKLTISDFIRIFGTGSGIFTNTAPGSTGNGGNISIDPKTVEILDGARISADSQGTGKPGNIDIVSDELLLLRRGGIISTNSAQDTDGGNIKINTGVLVALPNENSDITSNAVRGTGGRIDINALGIFGIEPRDALTDLSDITANSEFGVSGTITINNPEVDPNSGLIELPETVVDAKNQIAQNACQQGIRSELVATGRGGLPPSPTQDLRSSAVRVSLTTPVPSNTTNTTARKPKPTPTARKIVPAQGWIFNSKGQVVLTAYNPNHIGVQRTARKALCKEK